MQWKLVLELSFFLPTRIIGFIIDSIKNNLGYNNLASDWQLIWTQRNPSIDGYDKLEQLWNLKEKGIITEEEFQAKKKELLGL